MEVFKYTSTRKTYRSSHRRLQNCSAATSSLSRVHSDLSTAPYATIAENMSTIQPIAAAAAMKPKPSHPDAQPRDGIEVRNCVPALSGKKLTLDNSEDGCWTIMNLVTVHTGGVASGIRGSFGRLYIGLGVRGTTSPSGWISLERFCIYWSSAPFLYWPCISLWIFSVPGCG